MNYDSLQYAITVYRPYADALVRGDKQYETRPFQPRKLKIGDLLAIHAGKKIIPITDLNYAMSSLDYYPLDLGRYGAIIGIVQLMEVVPTIDRRLDFGADMTEIYRGNWTDGRYAWRVKPVAHFYNGVHVAGKQSLWKLDDVTRAAVIRACKEDAA